MCCRTKLVFFAFFLSGFFTYEKINGQCRNRCLVEVDGKFGFIDTLGHIIITPQYDYAEQFSENMAFVQKVFQEDAEQSLQIMRL